MFWNTSLLITFLWFSYFIVFLLLLFRMYQFFDQIQNQLSIDPVIVSQLKSLWLTAFSVQIITIGLTFIFFTVIIIFFRNAKNWNHFKSKFKNLVQMT
jgi:hypothetical protein